MFSSVFAACCAIISLAFVVKKQGNFAGTLDMFSLRDKAQLSKIKNLKRYSKNNTDVFKKIAKRCILYPLGKLLFCSCIKKNIGSLLITFTFFSFTCFSPISFKILGRGHCYCIFSTRLYSISYLCYRSYIYLLTGYASKYF